MRPSPLRSSLLAALLALAWAPAASAGTIAFWPMEAGVDADPNAFAVEGGVGDATRVPILDLAERDADGHPFVPPYDETTGHGFIGVDGVTVGWGGGPASRALAWGSRADVTLSDLMGHASAFDGTLDEARIMDEVAASGARAPAADPRAFALASAGLLGLFVVSRRR